MGVALLISALSLFHIIGEQGKNEEKEAYNNGICRKCGDKLEFVDTSSQGDRMYYCNSCKYYCWVSYREVDKFTG